MIKKKGKRKGDIPMNKQVLKEILSWVLVLVVAYALSLFINRFVIFKVEVPTGSMENTIQVGDRVITYRLSYIFGDPEREDIVVFPYPDGEEEDYIKRIIGLPGDTIEGKNGIVYINGEPLEESYVKEQLDQDFGPYKVPEGHYFMMGDNRNDSLDSRYWMNQFVEKDKIKGKALFKYPDFKWLN
jgi:signal peptidase I